MMMKSLRYALLTGLILCAAVPTQAQTILNTVTNSVAVTGSPTITGSASAMATTFTVSSTTNITATTSSATTFLFVPLTGELMEVVAVPIAGVVQVRRAVSPTRAYAVPITTTMIIVTSPLALLSYDPQGACTRGQGLAAFSPVINVTNGDLAVCRSSTWQVTNGLTTTFGSTAPFTP